MVLRRRTDIGVTNGNAFTAAIVHRQVQDLLDTAPHGRVAVVGATGSVGSAVTRLLARDRDVAELLLVARSSARLSALAAEVAGRVRVRTSAELGRSCRLRHRGAADRSSRHRFARGTSGRRCSGTRCHPAAEHQSRSPTATAGCAAAGRRHRRGAATDPARWDDGTAGWADRSPAWQKRCCCRSAVIADTSRSAAPPWSRSITSANLPTGTAISASSRPRRGHSGGRCRCPCRMPASVEAGPGSERSAGRYPHLHRRIGAGMTTAPPTRVVLLGGGYATIACLPGAGPSSRPRGHRHDGGVRRRQPQLSRVHRRGRGRPVAAGGDPDALGGGVAPRRASFMGRSSGLIWRNAWSSRSQWPAASRVNCPSTS